MSIFHCNSCSRIARSLESFFGRFVVLRTVDFQRLVCSRSKILKSEAMIKIRYFGL